MLLSLLLSICFNVVLLKKKNQTDRRRHRNLYQDIRIEDIEKIIKFDPFLMLIIGEERDSIYEKYKIAIQEFALKHTINKTWLHFANLNINHHKDIIEKYQLKKFPVFLHFYEGELVKKDYRVNTQIEPIVDLEIKFLHSILENQPSEKEFKELLDEYLYSIIIDIKKEETTHIDVNDKERVKFLKRIAETIASLPREEYVIIGIDFSNLSEEFKQKLIEKNNKIQFDGILLYSKEFKTIYELQQNQAYDVQYIKNWIYHHSHGILASPQLTYTNIVERKNWGIVYFFNSNNNEFKEELKQPLMYFEELAEQYKGKLQFTICDIYLEKQCTTLLKLFELEDKKLPLVRVLYAGKGQGNVYKVFKMQKKMYEQYLPEYENNKQKFELSNEGLRFFVRDFLAFDVDLDMKCSKMKKKNIKFLEESEKMLKKKDLAPLDIDRVVSINCSKILKITKIFKRKNIAILYFESKVHKKLKQQFNKVRQSIIQSLDDFDSKQTVFFAYDISHNTAHINDIKKSDLPFIRYYRRQDSQNGYYSQRNKTTNAKLIANAIIDFSSQDILINTEEIQLDQNQKLQQ